MPEAPAAAPAPAVPETPAALGVWDYLIADTPQGDAGGVLTLAWDGEAYSGEITNDLLFQTVDVEDFVLNGDQATFKATFDMQGDALPTTVTATLTGDMMVGKIEVSGLGSYDFEAERRTP